VVGSEEGAKGKLFRGLGNGELVGIAGALLWLDEHAEVHGRMLASDDGAARPRPA
jgi:hypothetical protein